MGNVAVTIQKGKFCLHEKWVLSFLGTYTAALFFCKAVDFLVDLNEDQVFFWALQRKMVYMKIVENLCRWFNHIFKRWNIFLIHVDELKNWNVLFGTSKRVGIIVKIRHPLLCYVSISFVKKWYRAGDTHQIICFVSQSNFPDS